MIITSITENTSQRGLDVEHGLSLYVQLADGRNVLFDMGQSELFARNAPLLGLSIEAVNLAIVSHGHYDHGGGLRRFLELNTQAPVYIHHDAFEPHYSLRDTGLRFIGLDEHLKACKQTVLCEDYTRIDNQLQLFAHVQGNCCNPAGNRLLYGPTPQVLDDFRHEQNLVIEEGANTVLLAGCAHRGIVNILRRATELVGHAPTHVLAGMHLVKSGLTEEAEAAFIRELAAQLLLYKGTQFYTMHCTGTEAFAKLKEWMGDRLQYLSCGDTLEV